MKLFALIKPHGAVVLLLIGLRAHALDSLELVEGQDRRVLSGEGLGLLFGVGLVLHGLLRTEASSTFV